MEDSQTNIDEKINMENPFEAQPEVSLGTNALTYGAILGGISVVYSLIIWLMGQTLNKHLGYVSILFTIGVMYYATKEYRDKHLGGYISYNRAFTSNFLIGLYAYIISAIFSFCLFAFIDPGLVEVIKQQAYDQAMQKNPNLSQEQIEQGMDKVKFLMSPAYLSIAAVFGGAIFSVVLGLIIAFVHKKEKPLF